MTLNRDRNPPFATSWLVAWVFCCAFVGCGGTSTTLSIETPGTTQSETEGRPSDHSATDAGAAKADDQSRTSAHEASQNGAEHATQPEAAASTTASGKAPELQPKLTMVDPARIVGSWRDSFCGTRTLTLNADGTAHMRLDFDFAGRLLYGSRLDFDMKWKLEDGVVTIDIINGQPAKTAKSALATWGKRYVYLLDHVEDNKVEMRDGLQATKYTLARLPEGAASTTRE